MMSLPFHELDETVEYCQHNYRSASLPADKGTSQIIHIDKKQEGTKNGPLWYTQSWVNIGTLTH